MKRLRGRFLAQGFRIRDGGDVEVLEARVVRPAEAALFLGVEPGVGGGLVLEVVDRRHTARLLVHAPRLVDEAGHFVLEERRRTAPCRRVTSASVGATAG